MEKYLDYIVDEVESLSLRCHMWACIVMKTKDIYGLKTFDYGNFLLCDIIKKQTQQIRLAPDL